MSELGSARTPTAVLESRGAFLKHPERARPFEPNTGRGVGPPPDWLHEHEKKLWDETVSNCAPGVFQSSDRHALLVYVMVMADLMPGKRGPGRPPKARFANLKADLLLKFWSKFGMTPTDRARIQVIPEKSKDNQPKTGLAKFTSPR